VWGFFSPPGSHGSHWEGSRDRPQLLRAPSSDRRGATFGALRAKAAVREFFDRLVGKPPVAVDSTVTKIDMGQLYLQAVKLANLPRGDAAIDITPTPSADEPADQIETTDDGW
jgi:hypothetical protein